MQVVRAICCLCALGPGAASATTTNGLAAARHSWVNLSRHTGTPGSQPVTQADYRQLLFELQDHRSSVPSPHVAPAQLRPYTYVSESRNNLGNRVPLSMLHWNRPVSANAPGRGSAVPTSQNEPETTAKTVPVFAVSPVRPVTYRGSELIVSVDPGDLFEENCDTTQTIVSLRLDAGDGSGWHAANTGQEVRVAYATTGTKTLTVEATLADGSVLTASSSLAVAALTTPNPTETRTLVADYPYNNTTGTLYIYKSGIHPGLRCPVLVAEGFDMYNTMDQDVLYNELNQAHLAETVYAYGRDLIVLDYANATRDIKENAALARAAITYVNSHRFDPSDKFVVAGASMGGLVTRIALADMDRSPQTYGASHVDTWISFDSPHKGANIPLGMQEFVKFFANKNSSFASAATLYSILNTPAARQMLLVHTSSTGTLAGNPSNTVFQAYLDVEGYPTSCKKIAISNGSGYGQLQPFDPGERVIHWYYRSFWTVDIDADIYALSTSSYPKAPTIFDGYWNTLAPFDEVSTAPARYYYAPLDSTSGGARNSFQLLFDGIPSDYKDENDYCLAPNHCFIPTVSSLGIDIGYCPLPVHTYEDFFKGVTPFDEIHYAYANETHTEINDNNRRWFVRAILEGYDTDGEGYDDYQEYLMGTAYDTSQSQLAVTPRLDSGQETKTLWLSWTGMSNVLYNVYSTESLSRDWSLIGSGHFSGPVQWRWQMDDSKTGEFFKVTAEIQDLVTD